MAAMATAPWSRVTVSPLDRVARTGLLGRVETSPTLQLIGWSLGLSSVAVGGSLAGNDSMLPSSAPPGATPPVYAVSAVRKLPLASDRTTRSCGRFGPASDGTTVA